MADTIISNTPDSRGDSGMAGWVLALLIIVALLAAGFVLYQNGFFGSASETTTINVTTPDPIAVPVPVPPEPAE